MIKKKKGISRKGIAAGVLAGAGLGAVVGRRAGAAAANRNIESRVAKQRAYNAAYNIQNESPNELSRKAAKSIYDSEYAKMPRVKSEKMAVYKGLVEASRKSGGVTDYAGSKRMAGMTKAEMDMYYKKSAAKLNSHEGQYAFMDTAKQIRRDATRKSATRKGALVGGLSGAAISAIAQLVAAELGGKKRRG
jgi:hypothetical protein